MVAGHDRLDGFLDALPRPKGRSSGKAADPRHFVEQGDFTEDSGEVAMRALLQRVPDLDAVFAANDLMAAGALTALRASGRRVPDDVAVIGFDDSVTARHTSPQLTTVRQPVEQLGAELARQLLTLLSTPQKPVKRVILPTTLVVRGSA
jgi:DNA-binding LacI/PurR family transcriptional regulator